MTLLDANVLIYAYNADAVEHPQMRQWLSDLFSGSERIGISWLVLWAFIRVATNPRLSPTPKPAAEAFHIVRTLLAQSKVIVIEPGPRHAEILERLVVQHKISGPCLRTRPWLLSRSNTELHSPPPTATSADFRISVG